MCTGADCCPTTAATSGWAWRAASPTRCGATACAARWCRSRRTRWRRSTTRGCGSRPRSSTPRPSRSLARPWTRPQRGCSAGCSGCGCTGASGTRRRSGTTTRRCTTGHRISPTAPSRPRAATDP